MSIAVYLDHEYETERDKEKEREQECGGKHVYGVQWIERVYVRVCV